VKWASASVTAAPKLLANRGGNDIFEHGMAFEQWFLMDGQRGRLYTVKFHREPSATCGPRGIDSHSLVGSLRHPLEPSRTCR
jgi:hypothetical protein